MINRNTFVAVLAACAIPFYAGVTVAAEGGHGAHWGYEGEFGPEHWGGMGDENTLCGEGKRQSPIDISAVSVTELPKITFSYSESPLDITDNGHTIKVDYEKGSSITVGGKNYELLQFHFHSPSEHTVGGKSYPMVVHLVHKAADGQLGVVGVMMREGNANDLIDQLWTMMPTRKDTEKSVEAVKINVASLLPKDSTYFNYSGSLTTPPCSEEVNWMVMAQPIEVSSAQIEKFRTRYSGNNRPVQSLHDRQVRLSN